ncbi:2-deoxy-glucose resistant protein 2 [Cyberlindnera fabianii]|uniref:2-deoxy-glucose resistant protein 2 n=1 Tax=Cyberlindnera fabianii TaxID=36022 RepID=A0A1V2LBU6_CYBFA|nr:2-deoxy-glucose resistant protein 2 [Cyberlindnera fabianii]
MANSVSSEPYSTSSKKHKRRSLSLMGIFGSRGSSSSHSATARPGRAESISSDLAPSNVVEDEESSDDDKSIDLTSYHAVVAPLKFNFLKGSSKRHPDGDSDLTERLHRMFDDEDFEKYLRQPKHIKTFRKSHKTAPICKRLFLAQELDQNAHPSLNGDLDQLIDGVRLDDSTWENPQDAANSTTGSFVTLPRLDSIVPPVSDPESKKSSIWALKFSHDGKYLASAGKGNVIRVWKVISSPLDRLELNGSTLNDEGIDIGTGVDDSKDNNLFTKMDYASVFQDTPYRSYYGHTHDILSLDWSKNNFLITSSMDKTVRLWNVTQTKCLRTFQHHDFVPSVQFHPTDDRFFVSGCLDHKVRLWSILENEVKFEFDAKNLVTAVAFTPGASLTIAGTFNGMVYFLDTQTLELRHALELNKKKNQNMKITGIECFNQDDDVMVVITSNDSRIRVISLKQKQMLYYLKGLDNNSSQIIATVSDDSKYIISGSENHWLYVWEVDKDHDKHAYGNGGKAHTSTNHSSKGDNNNGTPHGLFGFMNTKKKKRADYTSFHAHHHVVTCALVAPSGTFKALSLSNDYIYELNSEIKALQTLDDEAVVASGGASTSAGPLIDDESIGGIIVTADDNGLIRVFRQDLPTSVRKILLDEKKRKDAIKDMAQSLDVPPNHHRSLINKTFNGSTNSLPSRGNSMRSIGKGATSPDRGFSPLQGRSRSGTLDSMTQRMRVPPSSTTAAPTGSQRKIACDVCGGDKFAVAKSGNGLDVFCTDCGNQIKA